MIVCFTGSCLVTLCYEVIPPLTFLFFRSYWPKPVDGVEQWSVNNGSADFATLPQYSVMNQLEGYRSAAGLLTFKMVWPTLCSLKLVIPGRPTQDPTSNTICGAPSTWPDSRSPPNFISWQQFTSPGKTNAVGAYGFNPIHLGNLGGQRHGGRDEIFLGLEPNATNLALADGS